MADVKIQTNIEIRYPFKKKLPVCIFSEVFKIIIKVLWTQLFWVRSCNFTEERNIVKKKAKFLPQFPIMYANDVFFPNYCHLKFIRGKSFWSAEKYSFPKRRFWHQKLLFCFKPKMFFFLLSFGNCIGNNNKAKRGFRKKVITLQTGACRHTYWKSF